MKIDQIKQQIKNCGDYAYKLCEKCNIPLTGQLDIRPFSELKKTVAATDAIEATELDMAIKQICDDYKFIYSRNGYGMIDPISLGRICAVINMLLNKYKTIKNSYKIFISHSSNDKKTIEKFVKEILLLGCKVDDSDVFCTSIEGMNIRTGENIREHIKKRMVLSDYVFLMISEDYVDSKICLNEMGASWALDKKIKPFLFPPLKHNAIWLSEVLQNSHINDSAALDSLRDELIREYGLKTSATSAWNKQKNDFIAYYEQSGNIK